MPQARGIIQLSQGGQQKLNKRLRQCFERAILEARARAATLVGAIQIHGRAPSGVAGGPSGEARAPWGNTETPTGIFFVQKWGKIPAPRRRAHAGWRGRFRGYNSVTNFLCNLTKPKRLTTGPESVIMEPLQRERG